MRVGSVSSRDVRLEGARLTGGYHLSEDQRAVAGLRGCELPKSPLSELVEEHGIFRGPIFSRRYVDDPSEGEPYVSAKDLVKIDVRPASYLSRSHGALLERLRLREGMLLVTCSGMNLGKVIWTRADLDGLVGSHDLIRICPDAETASPGYLHAFLSCRYGHAYIRKQIYGGNIKHIEPHHVADLPVPRLDTATEKHVGNLVAEASELRSEAVRIRDELLATLTKKLGWHHQPASGLWATVSADLLQRRMDSFHHARGVAAARACLAKAGGIPLGSVVEEVFEPNRGSRKRVEDTSYGVPFLSSSAVFRLDPTGDYYISKTRTPNLQRLLVEDTDVLIPRSGQIGGIIGRAVLPLPTYYGSAASEHLVRVRCRSREDAYFAWAVLATEPGYYAAISTAFGSSIPSLDCALLAEIRVPWWEGAPRKQVVSLVAKMVEAKNAAILADRSALAIVERSIEEAS